VLRAEAALGTMAALADPHGPVESDPSPPDTAGVSVKTFTVHLPSHNKTMELRMRGDATIANLRDATLQLVQSELGGDVRPRVLGLPKGHPSLPLSELKLKAPHRVVMMPSPTHIFGHAPTPSRAARWLRDNVDEAHSCVLRDADEDAVSWSDDEGFERRVLLRIHNYDGFIKLNELDPAKKNLVLDL